MSLLDVVRLIVGMNLGPGVQKTPVCSSCPAPANWIKDHAAEACTYPA